MQIDVDSCRAGLARMGYRVGDGRAGLLVALFAFAAGRQANATLRAIAAAAAEHFPRFGMTSVNRIVEFIAQTAHETGGYTRFEENLNYSAQGLAKTWPSRFALDPRAERKVPNDHARALAGKPQAIANSVYARPREGNVRPGDGWRYRGRGMLQLTFRNNYAAAGRRLGLPLVEQPELAADPATSVLIALDFWKHAGVNACCDTGDFFGARGLTNAGTRTPKVPPIGLADVGVRRRALLALFPGAPGQGEAVRAA